jgi:hypothetical protein
MKTVARYGSLQEAQNLKLLLGSVGIESFIPDEISAGMAPMLFLNRVGVRVQVEEKDEGEAKRVIEEEFGEDGGER